MSEHNTAVLDYLRGIGIVGVITVADNQSCPDRCGPYIWRNKQLNICEKLAHNHGHRYQLTIAKNSKQYLLIPAFFNSLKSRYLELAHGGLRQMQPQSAHSMPNVYDMLSCVMIDSCANQMTFKEWCSDYGYSEDSIKAQGIYQECVGTAAMLQRIFTAEQLEKLSELCA